MDICIFNDHYFNPLLDTLSKEANKTIVLLGDFNIDLLNFDTSEYVSTFLDDLVSNSLQPQILLPTRISNNSKTLIGNIFCNILNTLVKSANVWKHLIKYIRSSSTILYTNRIFFKVLNITLYPMTGKSLIISHFFKILKK